MVSPCLPLEVVVHRGERAESSHLVHAVVAGADGRRLTCHGDPLRPTFARSAVKVIQALPLVETGAADRFGLDTAELAIACASHAGMRLHVDVVAGLLAKLGLDGDALACGVHWPLHEPSGRELAAGGSAPGPLHNNCSGKHAGFLAVARHLGHAVVGYLDPDHPVQRIVTATLAETTGGGFSSADRGIDGCSAPTFAVPLERLAAAFARLGTGAGMSHDRAAAAARLRAGVAAHPLLVAGPGRFDTRLIEAFGQRVFVKSGAEGVLCAAIPGAGVGIAVKAEDGAGRASEVAVAGLLLAHVPDLSTEERALLEELRSPALVNWVGTTVGDLVLGEAPRD